MDHVTYKGRTIIDFEATETTYKACMTLTDQNTLIAWRTWVNPMDKTDGKTLEDLNRLMATIHLLLETALDGPFIDERETTQENKTCSHPSS